MIKTVYRKRYECGSLVLYMYMYIYIYTCIYIYILYIFFVTVEELPLDENYDSDSSLTATINKSLDLGRSLGDKCSELTKMESSDDDTEESRREAGGKEEEEEEGRCMGNMQVGVELVVSVLNFRFR